MTSRRDSLEALVEILTDPTVVVDSPSLVTQVNASAEALPRWSRGKLLGQAVDVLVPNGLRQAPVRGPGRVRLGARITLSATLNGEVSTFSLPIASGASRPPFRL